MLSKNTFVQLREDSLGNPRYMLHLMKKEEVVELRGPIKLHLQFALVLAKERRFNPIKTSPFPKIGGSIREVGVQRYLVNTNLLFKANKARELKHLFEREKSLQFQYCCIEVLKLVISVKTLKMRILYKHERPKLRQAARRPDIFQDPFKDLGI